MRLAILTLMLLCLIIGCSSSNTRSPPPMPPSTSSPSSSPSMPSPSSPSSSPSSPSPSSPSSAPSRPTSSPSSAPSRQSPGPSGAPTPPSDDQAAKLPPAADAENGDPSAAQTAAGEALEQIGKAMSEAASEAAQADAQTQGDEPWDPLMPDPSDSSSSEGPLIDSATMQTGSQESNANAGDQAQSPSETNDRAATGDGSETTPSIGQPDDSSSEEASGQTMAGPSPTALEEALLNAGASLQVAGEALKAAGALSDDTDAQTNGDMQGSVADNVQDLDAALNDASIAILLVEQAMIEAEAKGDSAGEDIGQAARLLVLANEALQNATAALGENPAAMPGEILVLGGANQDEDDRIAAIDAKLDASIAIFESDVQAARDAVAETLSGPAAVAAAGPSLADLDEGLGQGGMLSEQEAAGSDDTEENLEDPTISGNAPSATNQQPGAGAIPDDIPSPQGDDIVAKQLREAATFEQDPELRAKLWEEYKRYKEGL